MELKEPDEIHIVPSNLWYRLASVYKADMAIRVTRYKSMPQLLGEPLMKGKDFMALQVDALTHYDPICVQLKK